MIQAMREVLTTWAKRLGLGRWLPAPTYDALLRDLPEPVAYQKLDGTDDPPPQWTGQGE